MIFDGGREEGEKMKDYNKENIPLAKTLRKNMTPWERKLWYDFLRNYPVRFQRQKAIGNYIVDFYESSLQSVGRREGLTTGEIDWEVSATEKDG